jgi:Predicted phosphatase
VHVPEGYAWKPLSQVGTAAVLRRPGHRSANGVSLENSDKVFGENTDGMELFVIGGKQVIAVNHEYVNNEVNLPHNEKGMPKNADEVKILQNLQGVTVMEVAEGKGGWEIVLDSPFNRRITHLTPMKISGPAAGSDLIKTEADPNGTDSLGTFNNCGAGKTPWGTYLTCEENFNGYFGSTDPNFAMPGRLQALRHRRRDALWLRGLRSTLRRFEEPQRTAPRRLHRRDRSVGCLLDADQAFRARPHQA